ncbi:Golgin candidate 4 [Citrus sinensis]|uniref:Golgin candidate 4 n=1 Tax=Citrus sinensis TaxID=2711 RepID=A0ACB8MPE6_CITSI|nr:golgin candidate 4 [Citrus sinensis]KAH9731746.1 Golgin candidate 4 [Citrus sinensis]KAH9787666.1 Golgin candidate 4 [Citrus sinensis]
MRGTLANYKENLNKIALDVHYDDDGEELKIYDSRNVDDMSVSDRRDSHSFANSKSVSWSPVSNGFESPHDPEIERYKAEIKRLQESEAEIKALSVNYAALLKEKEEQISRLNGEYGLLKQNLDATNAALNAFRNGNSKASSNGINIPKGSGDLSPSRQHKLTAQVKNRHAGHQLQNGFSKQDGVSNGSHALQTEVVQSSKMQGKEKELADLLEEKNRSLAAERAAYESQTRQLRMELEQQRNKFAHVQLKLQEEQRLNESFQDELKSLKMDKDKTSIEITEMRKELNGKLSELRRLQMELNRREDGDANDVVENLKRVVATLEKENNSLKMEKTELVAALEKNRKSSNEKIFPDASEYPSRLDGKMVSSESFPGKEEMEQSLQKLEKDLKETCSERDKALQELTRLKQHLIEKAQEESEKMDEDSKIIEELRENNEYQRAQILHLENVLKQTLAKQEEFKMMNHSEIQKSKEIIDGLNNKLANCMRTIEAKNVELLNLQTALGQYFAEIEAKGHLERELALAREESAKLSEYLKNADQRAEVSRSEKEEILVKLSHSEKMLAEGKGRANKLEEDNAKLRRAVEQSMTRLNRMSVDSDFLVDRRIVIKLLVTYFQRNHSKEVLDLMVRMLGFSDEDKQRIGMAQQGAGKGVVRGVLGLPGRLVGGIIGGSQADANAKMASENQSFADLWVDFLLKETEERERRESAENMARSKEDIHGRSQTTAETSPTAVPGFSRSNLSPSQNLNPLSSQGNFRQLEHSDSEFSTVPLSSSKSNSRLSRLLPDH